MRRGQHTSGPARVDAWRATRWQETATVHAPHKAHALSFSRASRQTLRARCEASLLLLLLSTLLWGCQPPSGAPLGACCTSCGRYTPCPGASTSTRRAWRARRSAAPWRLCGTTARFSETRPACAPGPSRYSAPLAPPWASSCGTGRPGWWRSAGRTTRCGALLCAHNTPPASSYTSFPGAAVRCRRRGHLPLHRGRRAAALAGVAGRGVRGPGGGRSAGVADRPGGAHTHRTAVRGARPLPC